MLGESGQISQLLGIRAGEVVSVLGAGGKHTLMTRLAEELVEEGRSVVVTSTTNLHALVRLTGVRPVLVVRTPEWRDAVRERLHQEGRTCIVQEEVRAHLFRGLPPEQVDELHGLLPSAILIVKADGARKRSLKAQGNREPVMPSSSTVQVVVLGLDAIGQPLDEKTVHRAERVAALLERPAGTELTAELVAQMLRHPGFYPDLGRHGKRAFLYFSKAAGDERLAALDRLRASGLPERFVSLAGDTVRGRFCRLT